MTPRSPKHRIASLRLSAFAIWAGLAVSGCAISEKGRSGGADASPDGRSATEETERTDAPDGKSVTAEEVRADAAAARADVIAPDAAPSLPDATVRDTLAPGPDAPRPDTAVVRGDVAGPDAIANSGDSTSPRADALGGDATGAGGEAAVAECKLGGAASLVHLTPLELKTLLDGSEDPFLINVKGTSIGQIPGTDAVLVNDLDGIEALVGKDHCANIILYCQSGGTTQSVGAQLIARGYVRVRDLAGGITAWKNAGYPTE